MKKYLLMAGILMMSLTMIFAVTACKSQEKEPAEEEQQEETAPEEEPSEGAKYGYDGDDPAEAAVFKYLAEEISKDYDKADASIPYGTVIATNETDPKDVQVLGDFWILNYDIDGETLKMVSGGAYPGCFHLEEQDDGTYKVTKFDQVEDGSEYEPSAKKIFGDNYETFSQISSDDETQEKTRMTAVSTYVKANGLDCTQYQDEGQDPVKLEL